MSGSAHCQVDSGTFITYPEMDKLFYLGIRETTREQYVTYLEKTADTMAINLKKERETSKKFQQNSKDKDILIQNSDANANFYRAETIRITQNCERNIRRANLIGTAKAVGTGIIGLVIGYIAYAIIN